MTIQSKDHLHLLSPAHKAAVLAKRADRERQLAPYVTLSKVGLNAQQQAIVDIDDVSELLAAVKSGQYTAVQVVEAYCLAATLAQGSTNCLTEVLFDRALRRARELDERKRNGLSLGPLHGLPVSVKDAFDFAGVDSCLGFVSRIGKPRDRNAAVVDALEAAGAVVFAKTAVPQALKWGETDNFIFGPTTHPDNAKLGPGGSSGGEGALLRSKGSIVGWGTDIGGSVRMPASHCGLFTLRPTNRRLSNIAVSNSMEGLLTMESTVGPMSRSLSGCVETFKAALAGSSGDLDSEIVEMPWREAMHSDAAGRKLSVGLMEWDEVVMPHPPVRRALAWTVEALHRNGHKVYPIRPFKHAEICALFDEIMQLDRGSDHDLLTEKSGEPIFPGNTREFQPNLVQLTGTEVMRINAKRSAMRQAFLRSHQSLETKVDCIICPMAPHAAPPHWKLDYYSYTKVWSYLDLPCGGVPVTVVNSTDVPNASYKPANAADRRNHKQYDPLVYERSPVGIQVVGKRYREEELFGFMVTISKALDNSYGTQRY